MFRGQCGGEMADRKPVSLTAARVAEMRLQYDRSTRLAGTGIDTDYAQRLARRGLDHYVSAHIGDLLTLAEEALCDRHYCDAGLLAEKAEVQRRLDWTLAALRAMYDAHRESPSVTSETDEAYALAAQCLADWEGAAPV